MSSPVTRPAVSPPAVHCTQAHSRERLSQIRTTCSTPGPLPARGIAVAGTSMGGIVGALYASGKTTDEIEDVACNLDWAEAFSDQPERGKLSFRRKQDSREYLVKAHATFAGGLLRLPKGIVQG